ncbi:MAG: transposase, partial [Rhodobacter sp.]|nr:transposase [Rhodobacter sp.]
LAGLAPVTRESGTWRGKATIQGGRRPLRRARTMPTLTAIRRNRDLAALFTRLSAAGKPPGARPCRGNAQTPHPRQHTPARRTGLAGHKANTKPLTNTDTGRGLWPRADLWHAQRRTGAPAPARQRRARAVEVAVLRPSVHAADTFSAASQRCRYSGRPTKRQKTRIAAGLAPLLQTRAANHRRMSVGRVPVPRVRPYSSTSPSFRGAGRGAGAAGLRRIRISPFSSITGAS